MKGSDSIRIICKNMCCEDLYSRMRAQPGAQANSITDESKKRSVLLSVIPSAYKLVRSLLAPAKPKQKAFKELTELMTRHYNPVPSEIVQRYKFHRRLEMQRIDIDISHSVLATLLHTALLIDGLFNFFVRYSNGRVRESESLGSGRPSFESV